MAVLVADVDVGGAGLVGLTCEGAGELSVLDLREEEDLLAGLDVGADPDDELGVALQAFVHPAIVRGPFRGLDG